MEVGIYGLGRFGSFYASLLSQHFTVRAYSRSPERSTPAGVQRVDEPELLHQPVLILCVAISSLREVLRRIAPRLRPGTLVMDTCSVKVLPVAWMEEILPQAVDILATHPMFGPDSARNGVSGLPLILSPVRLPASRLERWRTFFSSLGLRVRLMEPQDHDREAAFTQGLTHYLGRVLAELQVGDSPIASVGYEQLLKIMEQTCNDPWQLFLDLQTYNPYTTTMRQALNDSLSSINRRLDIAANTSAAAVAATVPEATAPERGVRSTAISDNEPLVGTGTDTANLTAPEGKSNMIGELGAGNEGSKNQRH